MTVAPVTETTPAARRRGLRPSASLLRFVLRRLGAFVLLMLGITFVAFVLTLGEALLTILFVRFIYRSVMRLIGRGGDTFTPPPAPRPAA